MEILDLLNEERAFLERAVVELVYKFDEKSYILSTFEKVSRSLKYDSNFFSDHRHIYIWTPRSITLPRSRCACGVINGLARDLLARGTLYQSCHYPRAQASRVM